MKSVNEIKKTLFATLSELESMKHDDNNLLQHDLRSKLSTIYEDILDEEYIPEEYWQRIEDQI